MGQNCQAIVYGVFPTAKQDKKLRDVYGEWWTEPPVEIETGACGLNQPRCLGITVAVTNCSEGDEAEFPVCCLPDLPAKLRKPLRPAAAKWKKLVKWAAEHGVVLPPPGLLFIQVERA